MSDVFVFDVDGTLTPARQPMTEKFSNIFDDFSRRNDVFLVSGSDYAKIQEQVPSEILDQCLGVFGCSGCELYCQGKQVFRKEHEFPHALYRLLARFLWSSKYPLKCGNHIELRTGMLNFSIVGRNADLVQRSHYHVWDNEHGERKVLLKALAANFADYEASAGGEISVDIVPNGWNKSSVIQPIHEFRPGARIHFFGDKMSELGNDYPLAEQLRCLEDGHSATEVSGWEETLQHLSNMPEKSARDLHAA